MGWEKMLPLHSILSATHNRHSERSEESLYFAHSSKNSTMRRTIIPAEDLLLPTSVIQTGVQHLKVQARVKP